ncbi:MAG TPA: class I SAM-dependent methyltransferase [Chitinophagaceae bacterium]
MSNKKWAGERLETFVYNESTIEHLHRYAIAMDLVKDKVVLDIACGEGYGSNLLANVARSVTGVEKDAATVKEAKRKYTKPNLQFVEGLAEKIPAADQSFDAVISFETLEHITGHDQMFREIKRVLKPGGLLIISTPDKKFYSDLPGYKNPFHEKELYEKEFREIISRYFRHSRLIYQRLMLSSLAWLPGESELKQYKGNYEKIISQEGIDPVYLLAIASDTEIAGPSSSIFAGEAILQTALEQKEKELKKTASYRVGHFLLFPFKLIRDTFKK